MDITATDRIDVSGDVVTFGIEVRVPFSQAEEFARRLTGDDNDIVLAAERALRDLLEYPEDGEEIELGVGPDENELRRVLREKASDRSWF